MPLPESTPLARAQAALADHVRDPALPPPAGMAPERLAVYTRLVRNNLAGFLDRCFSDSSTFVAPEQWQHWQARFLIDARPESPWFNDIPEAFLHYLQGLPENRRPPDAVLAMMDFETALLHAETAIQPDSGSLWDAHSLLAWAPAARLQSYPCDFIGSRLARIEETPCHALSWRDRNGDVCYCTVEGVDLFLLQHFRAHNDSLAQVLRQLQTLLPGQDADALLHETVGHWVAGGVLLVCAAADGAA